jgi:hypothetical protein
LEQIPPVYNQGYGGPDDENILADLNPIEADYVIGQPTWLSPQKDMRRTKGTHPSFLPIFSLEFLTHKTYPKKFVETQVRT